MGSSQCLAPRPLISSSIHISPVRPHNALFCLRYMNTWGILFQISHYFAAIDIFKCSFLFLAFYKSKRRFKHLQKKQ